MIPRISTTVSVRLPVDLFRRLDRASRQAEKTKPLLLQMALKSFLDKMEIFQIFKKAKPKKEIRTWDDDKVGNLVNETIHEARLHS